MPNSKRRKRIQIQLTKQYPIANGGTISFEQIGNPDHIRLIEYQPVKTHGQNHIADIVEFPKDHMDWLVDTRYNLLFKV